MAEKYYLIDCGGLFVRFSLIHPETLKYFAKNFKKCIDVSSEKISQSHEIHVTTTFMQENRWLVDENEKSQPFIEFQCLMLETGNTLLLHNRALFHGAAFLWRGKAWILTAPSGIGKTTQLRHWHKLFREDVHIINGDKPLIECRDDGSVWVHSSPWRGKEKFGEPDLHAPLGGIMILEQGDHNKIKRLKPEEAVRPLFTEFISYPENTIQIKYQAQLLRQILDTVPVWKLVNLGDEESALLTQQTLENYLEDVKDEQT